MICAPGRDATTPYKGTSAGRYSHHSMRQVFDSYNVKVACEAAPSHPASYIHAKGGSKVPDEVAMISNDFQPACTIYLRVAR
jgi:hypothetical protein